MKQFLLSAILFLTMANLSFAQFAENELFIVNPEWGNWWHDPGNIEEATFLVEPKGVYTEVQMFLTFAHGWGDVGNDSLEIVMNFTLPEGAIIHDSWLWIYDTPVQADILDVWTATAIYEAIVDRRTDPSLLFENEGGYQMRIYPLTAEEKRKVKITMLLPTEWSNTEVLTELPTNILQLSYEEIPEYRLLVKADSTWTNAALDNLENLEFNPVNDAEFGNVLEMVVTGNDVEEKATVSFAAPLTEGIYLNTYAGETENFYQMVLNPSDYGVTIPNQKIVFCFDQLNVNSDSWGVFELNNLFNAIKEHAGLELSDTDSFNIVYSHSNGSHLIFNEWQAFHPEAMGPQPLFYNHSDPEQTLLKAIDFIQNSGGDGEIFWISNSNVLKLPQNANSVINTVLDAANDEIPIHIFDFQNNWNGVWSNNTFYVGNRYFNQIITQQTGGNLYFAESYPSQDFVENGLSFLLQGIKNVDGNYDLYTTLSEGVCYSRFDVQNNHNATFSLHHPIKQVGKYVGEFPFEIEFTTITDTDFNVQNLVIEAPDLVVGDTLNEEMWAWHRIQQMEAGNPDNNTIANIVDYSTETRVLSKYTAFLAVEPTILPDEGCFNCWNDEQIVFTTDEKDKSDDIFQIFAAPNPFSNQVLINLTITAQTQVSNMQFQIYDQLGRLVAQPAVFQRLSDEKLQLTWNGKGSDGAVLPSGTYYLMVHSNEGSGSFKLLKI